MEGVIFVGKEEEEIIKGTSKFESKFCFSFHTLRNLTNKKGLDK